MLTKKLNKVITNFSNSSNKQITSLKKHYKHHGFTIVELLVVIVVIGILAVITIISYTGVAQKAAVATLKSDLKNASKLLAIDSVNNGTYPEDEAAANGGKGLPKSPNTIYNYIPSGAGYCISATSATAGTTYRISSDSGEIESGGCLFGPDWLTIGTQTWAKYNLNVGTMINGATNQTDNSILEKYCYNNNESNCTTYGGLYQWDEMMQYVTTEGAQGICPAGSHVPSDNDWKILEMQLGMSQEEADTAYVWRGTDQGTQLKPGGSSGLNLPLAGSRDPDGVFDYQVFISYPWSSSEFSAGSGSAWYRAVHNNVDNVFRNANVKSYGLSVRCLGN